MTAYFDYNATHPPLTDLLKNNLQKYFNLFGNPSGISFFSQKAQQEIEKCRQITAEALNHFCKEKLQGENFHFVSTGTEAVYQMVRSAASGRTAAVLTPYEHPAMYAACEDAGLDITVLSAAMDGAVDPSEIREKIKNTAGADRKLFVSTIAVSNESGAVQPVAEISSACREAGVTFISDTIQAPGKFNLDYSLFDAFTLNGHKFGAGPGCAALFFKSGLKAVPIFSGGLQEKEKRAGTENLFSILNFSSALAFQMPLIDSKDIVQLKIRNQIESFLKSECGAFIVAENSQRISNTTYCILERMDDMDFLFLGLDQKEIVASTGSSCKSRSRQPSSLLLSMGYSKDEALKALRISTGMFTTQNDVDLLLSTLLEIYKSLSRSQR